MPSSNTGIIRLDRRTQLLRAAAELFAEHGYATTSIDAIGAQAGVTGPAVYRHFSGKRDILLTLLKDAVDTALSGADDLRHASDDPLANLEAFVRQVVAYAIERRRVAGLLYAQHGTLAAGDRARVDALKQRVVETWSNALRDARPDLPDEELRLHVGAAIAVLSSIMRQLPETLTGEENRIYVRILMGLLTA